MGEHRQWKNRPFSPVVQNLSNIFTYFFTISKCWMLQIISFICLEREKDTVEWASPEIGKPDGDDALVKYKAIKQKNIGNIKGIPADSPTILSSAVEIPEEDCHLQRVRRNVIPSTVLESCRRPHQDKELSLNRKLSHAQENKQKNVPVQSKIENLSNFAKSNQAQIFQQERKSGQGNFSESRKKDWKANKVNRNILSARAISRSLKIRLNIKDIRTKLLLFCAFSVFALADSCRVGEIRCSDGTCLSPDKYCDGSDDCPEKEDEPRHCTPCGRIYYGSVGTTYSLEVHRPMDSKGPQECNLTFVATGETTGGDIVQLSILEYSLGKFHSHQERGCPHAHMQIIEYQRQYRHGYWCGNGKGMELYYSETPSVTVLLTMNPPDNDITVLDEYGSFYFRMNYKFLRQKDAVVRYGSPRNRKYTGLRDRTTACNVHFHSCDSSPCYVQSPNFPGLYPRNTTCYYTLKQPKSAPGTRAVLVLRQTSDFFIHIKSSKLPQDVKQRQLKMDSDCYYVGDYVRVYDGNSTISPVLITFCKGSAIPDIVSSGPDMLIEFTTSPFDEPDHDVPWKYLNGFELIATARFIKANELGPSCNKVVNGKKTISGWINSPQFSLAPNTTCTWDFKGPPGHVVWLIFAHYWIENHIKLLQTTLCAAKLTIFDYANNQSVIGSYCQDTQPKFCERAHRLHYGAPARPCDINETYISKGRHAAISQSYGESTVIKNVNFLLRYEFVDARLIGKPLSDPCDRILSSNGSGKTFTISAPKSVFLYGRGGRENIRCSWVLDGLDDESVQLNITSIILGDSKCKNIILPHTQALGCRITQKPYMSLAISEWPWMGVEVPKSCLCTNDSVPTIIHSKSSSISINLTIFGMKPNHDNSNFSFEASYRFMKREPCRGGNRRLESPAGELVLKSSELSECSEKPWLLTAPTGHSLLLTLPRAAFANESCASDSRVLLWMPGEESPSHAICPSADPSSVVKLLWPPKPNIEMLREYSNSDKLSLAEDDVARLVILWESRSISSLSLQWLRLWSPFNNTDLINIGRNTEYVPSHRSFSELASQYQCREWCPELNACISPELWCDGEPHCPNGTDEAVINCILERIPWLYIITTSVTLLILLLITASAVRRRHLQETKRRDREFVSTQETFVVPAKDNHHHRLSAFTTPEFTDMDFETTV